MRNDRLEVFAGYTQREVNDRQCYGFEMEAMKSAKERAKYVITKDYQIVAELSEPHRYSQVCRNGECIYDYFAKGYNG